MSKIRIETLASAMRELRKTVTIVPFDTDIPEEAVGLTTQRNVDPDKWGVTPIESWSKTQRRAIATKTIWDEMIHFLDDEPNNVKITFKYFIDGIQRTTPIGKIRLRKNSFETVPVHFAQLGAVLLKRENRALSREDEGIKFLIEYPNSFVRSETNVDALKDDLLGRISTSTGGTVQAVDTSYRIPHLRESEKGSFDDVQTIDGLKYPRIDNDDLWKWCADPAQFRNQARRWTTRYRDLLEHSIFNKALEQFSSAVLVGTKYEFVLKDGPLTHIRGGFTNAAIGIVKSFRTIFLERTHMTKVFGLPYGYRSPVFTKKRPEGDPEEIEIYDVDADNKRHTLASWYLRIRPVENHDPTWGLLRVEMHTESLPCQGHIGQWSEQDTFVIDEISRQLSFEASPSSHPDPRWHNLIYPIRCCENFLRSRIVPHVTARYLLGGV